LRVHTMSRIPALCNTVEKAASHVSEPGDPDYIELQQSFKDVQELWYIIRVLGDRLVSDPFVRPFVRAAANDCRLPEDAGKNTVGRDAQFELFVGAVGCRIGFDVKNLGEGQPDWLMATPSHCWSVETKRPKSAKKVERITKKAAGQIDHSLVGGVIIVDVSTIGGPENRRLRTCVSDDELGRARERMGEAIRGNELPRLKEAIGKAPVGLIIFHDFVIRPAGTSSNGGSVPWGLLGMWWSYHLESPDSQHYARYQEFWELFGSGLPDL